MSYAVPYLDCCRQPVLETIKSLYQSRHDTEALCQCQNCQRYWFYRFSEYVTFGDDGDDLTVWYSPLNKQEAQTILQSEERPDLSFLNTRTSFMEEAGNVRKLDGQPCEPWF